MRSAALRHGLTARLALCILLSLLLCGCSREITPIKIGLAINLSGASGDAGEHIRNGAMLAVQEINADGGIHGRPLELIIRDDRSQTETIRLVDQEMIDAGAIAIIGHSESESTMAALDLVTKQNTLLITAYTGATTLSRKDDLFFRTSVDILQQGKALADLLQQKQIKRAALLLDISNRSFVEDYARQMSLHFPGQTRQVELNAKEEIAWEQITGGLLRDAPEAIVLLTRVNTTAIAAQKLRAAGFSGPFFTTLWAQAPGLVQLGGKAVEGMELISFVDPHYDNPQYQKAATAMQQTFHMPLSARSIRAYELVHILAQALRQAPASPTAGDLKEQLLQGSFTGPMGTVQFDRFGDVNRPLYIVRVQDGKFIRSAVIPPNSNGH